MTIDLLFTICNSAVLPAWLLLVFLPRWQWTTTLVCSVFVPFMLAMVYLGLFVSQFAVMMDSEGFGSIQSIADMFQNPYLLTMGWVHYLAFDLFIGTWEVRDAQRQGINHWLVVPCLFFTFMAGPIGLGLYFLLRAVSTRKLVLYQDAASV